MEPLIEFKNVCFEYTNHEGDRIKALENISFNISKGEFVTVIGHNGSGKSTLAKLINALLKPSKGFVLVKGMDTNDSSLVWDIRRTAGMVFQNPDNQMVSTMVEEDVAFGPENLGVKPEAIRLRVDEALKTVDMSEFALRAPHFLSGGQKQRVAIAGILAMKPEIIVLDEPTAMLDPTGRQEVLFTIKRLNKEENITVVYITHYMEEAVEADRVMVMENGQIAMEGTPCQVFSKVDDLKKMGLDVPQAAELAHELRKAGFDIPSGILKAEELVGALCP